MKESTKRTVIRLIALALAGLMILPIITLTGCSSSPASSEIDAKEVWKEPVFDMEEETDRDIEIEVTDAGPRYIFCVDWQNPEASPEVVITAPNGDTFDGSNEEITSRTSTGVNVLVDPAQNGVYTVHIQGMGLGTITISNSSWGDSQISPLDEGFYPDFTVDENSLAQQILSNVKLSAEDLAYEVRNSAYVKNLFPMFDESLFTDVAIKSASLPNAYAVILAHTTEDNLLDAVSNLDEFVTEAIKGSSLDFSQEALSRIDDYKLYQLGDNWLLLCVTDNNNQIWQEIKNALENDTSDSQTSSQPTESDTSQTSSQPTESDTSQTSSQPTESETNS